MCRETFRAGRAYLQIEASGSGTYFTIARHCNLKISLNFARRQHFGVVAAAWWSEREANEDVA
jgi:hypothetical protein